MRGALDGSINRPSTVSSLCPIHVLHIKGVQCRVKGGDYILATDKGKDRWVGRRL